MFTWFQSNWSSLFVFLHDSVISNLPDLFSFSSKPLAFPFQNGFVAKALSPMALAKQAEALRELCQGVFLGPFWTSRMGSPTGCLIFPFGFKASRRPKSVKRRVALGSFPMLHGPQGIQIATFNSFGASKTGFSSALLLLLLPKPTGEVRLSAPGSTPKAGAGLVWDVLPGAPA